jgi:hypothetical protein
VHGRYSQSLAAQSDDHHSLVLLIGQLNDVPVLMLLPTGF